jgi:hypothetical protein
MTTSNGACLPEWISNSYESVKMNSSNIPNNQRMEESHKEALAKNK